MSAAAASWPRWRRRVCSVQHHYNQYSCSQHFSSRLMQAHDLTHLLAQPTQTCSPPHSAPPVQAAPKHTPAPAHPHPHKHPPTAHESTHKHPPNHTTLSSTVAASSRRCWRCACLERAHCPRLAFFALQLCLGCFFFFAFSLAAFFSFAFFCFVLLLRRVFFCFFLVFCGQVFLLLLFFFFLLSRFGFCCCCFCLFFVWWFDSAA